MAKSWLPAASLLAFGLAACAPPAQSDGFWSDPDYWQASKPSEAALAAVARGDFVRAEAMGNEAMRRNPRDPFAILSLAEVYENTGRGELAREYYQSLVRLNPPANAVAAVGPPMPIAELAQRHLQDPARQPAPVSIAAPWPQVSKSDLRPPDPVDPPTAGCSGPNGVRLASFLSDKRARQGWRQLKARHPALLGRLRPAVVSVTLRDKGTVFRLAAGPLTGCKAALDLCRQLAKRGQECVPASLEQAVFANNHN